MTAVMARPYQPTLPSTRGPLPAVQRAGRCRIASWRLHSSEHTESPRRMWTQSVPGGRPRRARPGRSDRSTRRAHGSRYSPRGIGARTSRSELCLAHPIRVGLRENLIEAHLPLPARSARASRPHVVAGLSRLVGRDQQRTVRRVGAWKTRYGGERCLLGHCGPQCSAVTSPRRARNAARGHSSSPEQLPEAFGGLARPGRCDAARGTAPASVDDAPSCSGPASAVSSSVLGTVRDRAYWRACYRDGRSGVGGSARGWSHSFWRARSFSATQRRTRACAECQHER